MVLASDGAEGIALARSELPDLVLMDIRMPGMSGLDAAAIITAEETTRGIPIVGMTADTLEPGDSERADAVFQSRMQKPLAAALIEAHVRSIIGQP